MYNLAMRLLLNHHDSEDVIIDSFRKVFDKISDFEYRGDNSFAKWLKTIVFNGCLKLINSKKPLQFEEDLSTSFDYVDKVDTDMLPIDIEEVYGIIENMSIGYRTIFNLYAIEGYTHKEIADMLSISQNTSKSQLNRARKFIIAELDKTKNHQAYGTK